MPSRVAKLTVTFCNGAADAVTVNVAVLDPLTGSLTVVLRIASRGPSSSVMVPVAVPRSIVALVAPLRLTSKRSSASVTVSPQTVTVASWLGHLRYRTRLSKTLDLAPAAGSLS